MGKARRAARLINSFRSGESWSVVFVSGHTSNSNRRGSTADFAGFAEPVSFSWCSLPSSFMLAHRLLKVAAGPVVGCQFHLCQRDKDFRPLAEVWCLKQGLLLFSAERTDD